MEIMNRGISKSLVDTAKLEASALNPYNGRLYVTPALKEPDGLCATTSGIRSDKRKRLPNIPTELIQLKELIENYVVSTRFRQELHFGYFLNEYIKRQGKLEKQFAKEVSVTHSAISQYLSNKRYPAKWFVIRLELHSNGLIPALLWIKLVHKQREQAIVDDLTLRKDEDRFVTKGL